MNQEDVLVLLVVFVLGFVVSQMMSGRLVEGGLFDDITSELHSAANLGQDVVNIGGDIGGDVEDLGGDIGHGLDNYLNPLDGTEKRGKTCNSDDDCNGTCGHTIFRLGQEKCFKKGTIQGDCGSGDECGCVCDGRDDDYEATDTVVF
tara:strand:+ start:324 stop:764 length:441 start_codon:yes stop_codon:yes gene_type:complete